MSSYPVHTIESAPAQSKPVLRQLQQTFGLIPNIAGAMAASPVLINGFIGLFERVHASSLTEPQIQTLLLTNAVTNASEWPVAFHTALALKEGVHPADVDAIRQGSEPPETKLAALSALARTLIEKRGRLAVRTRDASSMQGSAPSRSSKSLQWSRRRPSRTTPAALRIRRSKRSSRNSSGMRRQSERLIVIRLGSRKSNDRHSVPIQKRHVANLGNYCATGVTCVA